MTFNYDRLLESLFHNALANSFGTSNETVEATLKDLNVAHVHGQVGEFMDSDAQPSNDNRKVAFGSMEPRDIGNAAELLKFAHDPAPAPVDSAWLGKPGMRVVFLGFAFDPDNCAKLGIDGMLRGKSFPIYATMIGRRTAMQAQAISNYGIQDAKIYPDIRSLIEALPS